MLNSPITCSYQTFFKISSHLLYTSSESNVKLDTLATIWEISGERRKDERETSS